MSICRYDTYGRNTILMHRLPEDTWWWSRCTPCDDVRLWLRQLLRALLDTFVLLLTLLLVNVRPPAAAWCIGLPPCCSRSCNVVWGSGPCVLALVKGVNGDSGDRQGESGGWVSTIPPAVTSRRPSPPDESSDFISRADENPIVVQPGASSFSLKQRNVNNVLWVNLPYVYSDVFRKSKYQHTKKYLSMYWKTF